MRLIAFDVEIIEWQKAGLMRPSVVRLHKINTVEKRLLERQLGTLQANDWEKVCQNYGLLFNKSLSDYHYDVAERCAST